MSPSHSCKIREPDKGINSFWETRASWTRLKESEKVASINLCSLKSLLRPLDVCQTRSLPLRPRFWDKQIGIFHRKTRVYFSLLSVQCLQSGRLPRTILGIVSIPWDPGMQTPLASRAWPPRGIPWVVAAKIRAPDACKRSLL